MIHLTLKISFFLYVCYFILLPFYKMWKRRGGGGGGREGHAARGSNGNPYFFPNEELQQKDISHHILCKPGRIQGLEHKIRYTAVSSPPNPEQEEAPLWVGGKGIYLSLWLFLTFLSSKNLPILLCTKSNIELLGADWSTLSGFGEDCFFSVIRMI